MLIKCHLSTFFYNYLYFLMRFAEFPSGSVMLLIYVIILECYMLFLFVICNTLLYQETETDVVGFYFEVS
jgi:hypothetical protein